MAAKKSKQYRQSVTLSEAVKLVRKMLGDCIPNRPVEKVDITESLGRELAEDVLAKRPYPAYNYSLMDGFAIRSEDEPPLKVVNSIMAGAAARDISPLEPGQASPIATGAPLPEGANTVLKLEDAQTQGNQLIGINLSKWTHVARRGVYYKKGTLLIKKGNVIRPQELALLTEMGEKSVSVFNNLKVGVFASGEEIAKGMVPDTNSPMIIASLLRWGCEPIWLGIARDTRKSVEKKIKRGLKTCDVLISSGGVSVGKTDFLPDVLCSLGSIVFRKVTIRPGKPLMAGLINGKPVFCLPGKPTGAFTALNLVVQNFFTQRQVFPVAPMKLAQTVLVDDLEFTYVVFLKFKGRKAYPLGYRLSGLKLQESGVPYAPGIVSSTARASVADGFLLTTRDLLQGETVEVSLLT